jgi:putative FmdB family regulatory protein
MPVYEYQCKACHREFEYQQRMSEPEKTTCEACGKDELERLISRTAFQLKGGGWYKDLYSSAKPGSSSDSSGGSSASTTTPAAADKPAAAAADKPAAVCEVGFVPIFNGKNLGGSSSGGSSSGGSSSGTSGGGSTGGSTSSSGGGSSTKSVASSVS